MEITPETEARLQAVAAQRGLTPEQTIIDLLTEQEKTLAALRASVEDFAAGRWISLEDYEAQILAERQAHEAVKDKA
jgi:predicted transcriptional regulator